MRNKRKKKKNKPSKGSLLAGALIGAAAGNYLASSLDPYARPGGYFNNRPAGVYIQQQQPYYPTNTFAPGYVNYPQYTSQVTYHRPYSPYNNVYGSGGGVAFSPTYNQYPFVRSAAVASPVVATEAEENDSKKEAAAAPAADKDDAGDTAMKE